MKTELDKYRKLSSIAPRVRAYLAYLEALAEAQGDSPNCALSDTSLEVYAASLIFRSRAKDVVDIAQVHAAFLNTFCSRAEEAVSVLEGLERVMELCESKELNKGGPYREHAGKNEVLKNVPHNYLRMIGVSDHNQIPYAISTADPAKLNAITIMFGMGIKSHTSILEMIEDAVISIRDRLLADIEKFTDSQEHTEAARKIFELEEG